MHRKYFEVVICIQSRTRLVRESGSEGSVLVIQMGRTTRTQNSYFSKTVGNILLKFLQNYIYKCKPHTELG